eukprot:TRINITY_DN38552_c0_g1_i2.p1 TRINITY_DN38552_c0_g1~~TRINITY_DN38552_c0_g1_i2.p1  ORF type:complete len:495 (+),score=91.43 TRINITY_DN38552_c0_g1_i2:37-1485(+)
MACVSAMRAMATMAPLKTSWSALLRDVAADAVVVGSFENGDLTPLAKQLDSEYQGALARILARHPWQKKGPETRVLLDLCDDLQRVALVKISDKAPVTSKDEGDLGKKARELVKQACHALRDAAATKVVVESMGVPTAAAEGAVLSVCITDELKAEAERQKPVDVVVVGSQSEQDDIQRGIIVGESQNFTRCLVDTPANLMTPTIFCSRVGDELKGVFGVDVIEHGPQWIKEMKMGAFAGVSRGSAEEPRLLEIRYSGGDTSKPIVLVGKGVTFDSGGISIKPSQSMHLMKGDMGGAAAVAGTLRAIALLKLPVNVVGLMPLCENMPSSTATKPGDVHTARDGTTIEIQNTDAEGRLILADALVYGREMDPHVMVDVATLTGAIEVALGSAALGCFTPNDTLWKVLEESGKLTGDVMWRMPLFDVRGPGQGLLLTPQRIGIQETAQVDVCRHLQHWEQTSGRQLYGGEIPRAIRRNGSVGTP